MLLARLISSLANAVSAGLVTEKDCKILLSQAAQAAGGEACDPTIDEAERRASLQSACMQNVRAAMDAHPKGRVAGALAVLLRGGATDGPSIEDKAQAIRTAAFSGLSGKLEAACRKNPDIVGDKINPRNVMRELYGADAKDALAKAAAKALRETAEDLSLRLDAAGGWSGRPESAFPVQSHDAGALSAAGFDTWMKSFDLADWEMMRETHALDDIGLDRALRGVFEALSADGADGSQTDAKERAAGQAGTMDRRAASGFLTFASANGFMRYHDAFGQGDLLGAMIDRMRFLCDRIALTETLGPDCEATLRMMEELAQKTDKAAFIGRIGQAYDLLMGKEDRAEYRLAVENAVERHAAENRKPVQPLEVAALSDFVFLKDASFFAKIPDVRMLMHYVRKLDPANPKDRTFARRAAGIADCFIRAARRGQRLTEEFGQTGLTRFIVHAPLAAPGLKAHGDAVRDAFRLEMLAILADMSDRSWASLPAEIRAVLKQGGLDEKTWDAARRFALLDDGFGGCFMDPGSLIRANDPEQAKAGRMIDDLVRRSVASIMPKLSQRGDFSESNEKTLRPFMQHGTFGVSLLLAGFGRIWHAPSGRERLQGLVEIAVSALLLGALSAQLNRIAASEAPCDALDVDFWRTSFVQGGGVGLYGDFLQSASFEIRSALAIDPSNPESFAGESLFGPAPSFSMNDEACFGLRAIRLVNERMPDSLLHHVKRTLDRAVFWNLLLAADPGIGMSMLQTMDKAEKQADRDYLQAEMELAKSQAAHMAR